MKIQKYTNGAWADLDKPVKKFATYTDEATTLPLPIEVSATDAVENYQVYGAASGAGVQTENLFDKNATDTTNGYVAEHYIRYNGETLSPSSVWFVSEFISIPNGTTILYIKTSNEPFTANNPAIAFYDENKEPIPGVRYEGKNELIVDVPQNTKFARMSFKDEEATMLIPNSIAPSTYIPYGYKIPILLESGEQQNSYNLYIGDTKLGEDEYLDYGEQKIYKDVSGTLTPTDPPEPFPTLTTYLGENSIYVDTTTVPDKVVVEYKGWKSIGEPQIYDGGEWKDEPSEDVNLVYQLDNASSRNTGSRTASLRKR